MDISDANLFKNCGNSFNFRLLYWIRPSTSINSTGCDVVKRLAWISPSDVPNWYLLSSFGSSILNGLFFPFQVSLNRSTTFWKTSFRSPSFKFDTYNSLATSINRRWYLKIRCVQSHYQVLWKYERIGKIRTFSMTGVNWHRRYFSSFYLILAQLKRI